MDCTLAASWPCGFRPMEMRPLSFFSEVDMNPPLGPKAARKYCVRFESARGGPGVSRRPRSAALLLGVEDERPPVERLAVGAGRAQEGEARPPPPPRRGGGRGPA